MFVKLPIVVPEPRGRRGARCRAGLAAFILAAVPVCAEETLSAQEIAEFAAAVSARHGLPREEIARTLGAARVSPAVLEAISRPAEAKPWYQYRLIFVTDARAAAGVRFWNHNAEALARAERRYRVPPEIVVAIIGVETFYGRHTGGFRVLDALATLAFRYPKRAAFFRSELEEFLLLAAEQGLSPLALTGSYAGAMGMPQFIASSYRAYAVDFDGDGVVNIWDNADDAVGSVANYLHRHGWQPGAPVAVPARADGVALDEFAASDLKPHLPLAAFLAAGIEPQPVPQGDLQATLVRLEGVGGEEHWLGFDNFYVITRYNRSALYAMAVLQLAERIRAERESR